MSKHSPARELLETANTKISNKFLLWAFPALALIFFVLSLARPFPTDDVLLYSMIGKAIYEKGLMPFTYVFDHKPIFTYYLYGLVASIFPDNVPKYQVISILGYAFSAFLTRAFSKRESWGIHFVVILILSIKFLRFNANTQLFFCPLALLSVFLCFRNKRPLDVILAGAFAAISFNINYSASFVIAPPVLYTLFTSGEDRLRQLGRLVMYGCGFLLAFALILAPPFLKDPNLVPGYFQAQRKFLDGYSGFEYYQLTGFIIASAILFCLMFAFFRCEDKDRRVRNIMVVAFLASFASTIPSGKFYMYYLYAQVLPLTVLYSTSINPRKRLALLGAAMVLLILVIRPYSQDLGPFKAMEATYDLSQFRKLKSIVGEEKMLSIRANHGVTYFSDVKPAQPLIWFNHAEIIYGPKEDDYFLGYLKQKPKFVATVENLCTPPKDKQRLPMSCAAIASDYSEVMRIKDYIDWRRAIIYTLNPARQ